MRKNLLLLGVTIVMTLLICEALVRLIGYERMTVTPLTGFHEYDGELGWKLIPNYKSRFVHRDFDVEIRTNSNGFRDDEYEAQKSKQSTRVVILGDSFTWGWGVENDEVYMQVAESLLDDFEIINMGQNGYGTGQELLLFKRDGKPLSPDLVTVGFYWNDLDDNISGRGRPLFDVVDGNLEITGVSNQESLELRIKSFFMKNSYLFVLANYGYQRMVNWFKQFKLRSPAPSSDKREQVAAPPEYLPYLRQADATQRRKWDIFEKTILELKREASGNLLILFIPRKMQVETDRSDYMNITSEKEIYDIDNPNRILQEICEKNGIYYLDLTERLRGEYAVDNEIYFAHDGHMTRHGHRIAGEALADELVNILGDQSQSQ